MGGAENAEPDPWNFAGENTIILRTDAVVNFPYHIHCVIEQTALASRNFERIIANH